MAVIVPGAGVAGAWALAVPARTPAASATAAATISVRRLEAGDMGACSLSEGRRSASFLAHRVVTRGVLISYVRRRRCGPGTRLEQPAESP